MDYTIPGVLILILLEVTQIKYNGETHQQVVDRLNPYSTGSNSNNCVFNRVFHNQVVLILILLEVTQIYLDSMSMTSLARLNPYSTGSNSNTFNREYSVRSPKRLNPYSTGSNSNKLWLFSSH